MTTARPGPRHETSIATLESRLTNAFWREQRRRSIEALELRPGDRALSVGCGLGAAIGLIAERVSGSGEAIGVEASSILLDEARLRVPPSARARFEQARADSLPFEPETFDALLSEGALQHVGDAQRALSELWRLARPGARIVALEPDWDTFVIDGEPLTVTRSFCRRLAERFESPVVGRELAGWLHALGAEHVAVETATNVISDYGAAEREFSLTDLSAVAVADGDVPAEVAERWLEDLRVRDRAGRFLAAATYFLVAARKPPA